MTDHRPEPLVPAEVDLRDYPFTPMFRARLFGSEFHAHANDPEWRAGVTLWLKSWDQVPAGTLPTDDTSLCRLAELGRDLKRWGKVKVGAMRGWFECSDGRLHHKVVAEGVTEAWSGKRKASDKGKAGASKRWNSRYPQASETDGPGNATAIENDGTGNSAGNATAIARAMPSDSNREGEGYGQGKGEKKKPDHHHDQGLVPREDDNLDLPPALDRTKPILDRICEIFAVRLQDDPARLTWKNQVTAMLSDGLTEAEIIKATEVARANGKRSLSYVRAVAMNPKPANATHPGNGSDLKPQSPEADRAAANAKTKAMLGLQ